MSGNSCSASRAMASSVCIGSSAVAVAVGGNIRGQGSNTLTGCRPVVKIRSRSRVAFTAAWRASECGFIRYPISPCDCSIVRRDRLPCKSSTPQSGSLLCLPGRERIRSSSSPFDVAKVRAGHCAVQHQEDAVETRFTLSLVGCRELIPEESENRVVDNRNLIGVARGGPPPARRPIWRTPRPQTRRRAANRRRRPRKVRPHGARRNLPTQSSPRETCESRETSRRATRVSAFWGRPCQLRTFAPQHTGSARKPYRPRRPGRWLHNSAQAN